MKKGFSLVELIGVIVALGILSAIATQQISHMIKESKINANIGSLESHIDNIETHLGMNFLNNQTLDGKYEFLDLGIKDYPESDTIRCEVYKMDMSSVKEALLCNIDEKNYCYKDGVASLCGTLFIIDMPKAGLGNGDLDTTTGEEITNKRRMRTSNYYKIEWKSYNVEITKDYGLTVFEYDENQNFLRSLPTYTDKDTYIPSRDAVYMKWTLRAPTKKEKTMSNGQWYAAFKTGIPVARIYVGDIED